MKLFVYEIVIVCIVNIFLLGRGDKWINLMMIGNVYYNMYLGNNLMVKLDGKDKFL